MDKFDEQIKKYGHILDMANVSKDVHGLKYDIAFHIPQPGLNNRGRPINRLHIRPEIKVYKYDWADGFTVPIYNKTKVKGDWKNILKKVSEYKEVVRHIIDNSAAYLLFYCSPQMGTLTLKQYVNNPEKAKTDLKKLIGE